MAFERIKRTRVADQIATRIRDAILGGGYDPGDSLPAERELADQFGVNRSSIREALRRLEAWGLIESRHGGGNLVTDFLATAGLHLLPFLIAPGGALDPKLLRDLLELRVVLLGWTAQRAAECGTADDIEALRDILERLEAATELAARQTLDFDFYEQLVAMTDNSVLALFANALRRVYLENASLFHVLYTDFDTRCHRRAVEAIAEGRAADAHRAMTEYASGALAASAPSNGAPRGSKIGEL